MSEVLYTGRPGVDASHRSLKVHPVSRMHGPGFSAKCYCKFYLASCSRKKLLNTRENQQSRISLISTFLSETDYFLPFKYKEPKSEKDEMIGSLLATQWRVESGDII